MFLSWIPVLLHGDHASDGSSHYGLHPDVQKFIDSGLGQGIGLFLHTVGVFVFVAGLGYAAFRVWRPEAQRAFRAKDLEVTRSLVWGGLAMNLLGGLVRLMDSGHPTLAALGTNDWVRLIFLKHLAWVVLIVVSFRLVNRTLPRYMVATGEAGQTRIVRAERAVYWSVVTVLLVAGIGAAASTIGPGPVEAMDEHAGEAGFHGVNRTETIPFAGTLTGAPGQRDSDAQFFDVPANTTRIVASLQWTSASAVLTLELVGPDGGGHPASGSGQNRTVTIEKPPAGRWRIVEASEQALRESYEASVRIDYVVLVPH